MVGQRSTQTTCGAECLRQQGKSAELAIIEPALTLALARTDVKLPSCGVQSLLCLFYITARQALDSTFNNKVDSGGIPCNLTH